MGRRPADLPGHRIHRRRVYPPHLGPGQRRAGPEAGGERARGGTRSAARMSRATRIMIELVDITKRYGTKLAVDRLTLRIAAGELFAFLGPNGAGKTTTIKML